MLSAQQPTCNKCNATYVSSDEIQSYPEARSRTTALPINRFAR